MSSYQSNLDGPDSGFFSASFAPIKKDINENESSINDATKLRAELDSFKNSLKIRVQDLMAQQELTRHLEDELQKIKMDLAALQKDNEKQDFQKEFITISTRSPLGKIGPCEKTLYGTIVTIEESLQNLFKNPNCGFPECKAILRQEIEKIRGIKKDIKILESNRVRSGNSCHCCGSKSIVEISSCKDSEANYSGWKNSKCNLMHLCEVEAFRDKAVIGVAALEEMKGQIDILENVVQKYFHEFPNDCDKSIIKSCEQKFESLRSEFDEITEELCCIIQKYDLSSSLANAQNSNSYCCAAKVKSTILEENEPSDISLLKTNCQKLQLEICDQEKKVQKLQELSRQLEEELQQKRAQLAQENRNLDSKKGEICKITDLMVEVSQYLRETQCGLLDSNKSPTRTNVSNLKTLFCSMQEFCCILENTKEVLIHASRFREDNEKLREKMQCLEKFLCNKEETLRALQDTVKLRECQIEEFNCKMQSSESQTSKLSKEVEEKCRLIAELQESVRKCKQFEVNVRAAQMESLHFKICDLDTKLQKSEKEVVAKEKKLENLHQKIIMLTSKNYILRQEINVIEPRLKSMYKTCHMFEKMVNDLQRELNERECEIEHLFGKIKDLEDELDQEFRNCESRAVEDSALIEKLNATVQNFQRELYCTRENCNITIAQTEDKLLREQKMSEKKECELKDKIYQLKEELKVLRNQLGCNVAYEDNTDHISRLEDIIRESECRQQVYDEKIGDLQNVLECTMLEHEEERKIMLQKLCDEKNENVKNKSIITKLNENLKQKILHENALKECIEKFSEDYDCLKAENQELKDELNVRSKMMNSLEENNNLNFTELEELICQLKMQKEEIKTRCCNLKVELDREIKLKRILEIRADELNTILNDKLREFDEVAKNYNYTQSKLQENLMKINELQDASENNKIHGEEIGNDFQKECQCLKKAADPKNIENVKLFTLQLISEIDKESLRTEYLAYQTNNDCLISRLKYEASFFKKNFDELQEKYKILEGENKRIQAELDSCIEKTYNIQTSFKEKQKELCLKLRLTISEKNELLSSVDKLQRQLEQMCLESVNKDETNRELAEECSRLKMNNGVSDSYMRNKADKIICDLNKEIQTLQCELCTTKENHGALNEDYQILVEDYKTIEKKKLNLEKLHHEVSNENCQLRDIKMKMEKELCELQTQNVLLKEKIMALSKRDNSETDGDKQVLFNKLKEMSVKIKTFEKRIIPNLEQELASKTCCVENLKAELQEANISSQRMRNAALKVLMYTKKYLAAQRCANDTLKSRLECSNKRGNLLGAENRELEEQLKTVTKMNEYLLRQLECSKTDVTEADPRSFSPLPWGCATVERDTSSSEYLAESGIQSMQQSPTNLDCNSYDLRQDPKRGNFQCNSLKKNKCGGSSEYPCRTSIR